MKRWIPVFRRELVATLTAPAMLLFAALFFAMVGILFHWTLGLFTAATQGDQGALAVLEGEPLNVNDFLARNFFGIVLTLLVLAVPLLTMRLVAEEKKLGTFDLLLSYPLREADILLGKFFSAWAAIAVLLGLSLLYPVLMWWASAGQLEIWPVVAAYIGLLCASAGFVALGLLASALTENQLVAGLLSLGVLLLGLALGNLAPSESGWITSLLQGLDLYARTEGFLLGVIRLADVSHFALMAAVCLYLAEKVLAFRRLGVLR